MKKRSAKLHLNRETIVGLQNLSGVGTYPVTGSPTACFQNQISGCCDNTDPCNYPPSACLGTCSCPASAGC
jgi:hypothetical protein